MKVAVSFLKSNYSLAKTLNLIEKSKADIIHVDVTDGLFVSSKTVFDKEKLDLLKQCQKPKEVHLMTLHLKDYIDCFTYIKPTTIILAYEATTDTEKWISYIKEKNIGVGLAIDPFTDIDQILPFINRVDQILVMSVIPGYGAQKFLPVAVTKIKQLYQIRKDSKAKFQISVDGGIDENTLAEIASLVDTAVSGSYVCLSGNYNEQITKLKELS